MAPKGLQNLKVNCTTVFGCRSSFRYHYLQSTLSIDPSLCLSRSTSLPLALYLSPSLPPSLALSLSLSVHACIYMCVYIYIYIHIHMYIYICNTPLRDLFFLFLCVFTDIESHTGVLSLARLQRVLRHDLPGSPLPQAFK